MAVVTFSQAVDFDIGVLRQLLGKHLGALRWQCGEDDIGSPQQVIPFSRNQLIIGRTGEEAIFVELRPHEGSYAQPAPPHGWHLEITDPTTEYPKLSMRIRLIVAAAMMKREEASARFQLKPGGNWMAPHDVTHALSIVEKGEDLSPIDALGIPASHIGAAPAPSQPAAQPFAGQSPQARSAALGVDTLGLASLQRTFATLLNEKFGEDFARECGHGKPPPYIDEGVRENRLPTMVLLLDRPPAIDWVEVLQGVQAIDHEGEWRIDGQPDGSAEMFGRATRITIEAVAEPMPGYLIEGAFARSFWFPDGAARARARNHCSQLVLRCEIDTRAMPYEDVRQTAKVASLVLGLIAFRCDPPALYNAGIETIVEGSSVSQMMSILAQNEIPIQLWTWTAPHALESDAISLSTGGFLPFFGYEIEIWNAPGDKDFVAEKLNGTLRYLLHNGPVIEHGHTIGASKGDRSTRCFFGDSKADRSKPVKAMFLELGGPPVGVPRPELGIQPPPSADPARANIGPNAGQNTGPAGFGRRTGGFGRKGL